MRLREYIESSGLRQDYFAKRCGMTKQKMSRILKPGYNPDAFLVDLIEKYTGGKVKFKDWIDDLKYNSEPKNVDLK
jgi:transcriptional regulator with XRE-family HTH domain